MAASLTSEEITQYTAWLSDAESAYHKLMTGQSAKVYVDQNGERVEYSMQKATDLKSYIAHLRSLLGKPQFNVIGPLLPRMM